MHAPFVIYPERLPGTIVSMMTHRGSLLGRCAGARRKMSGHGLHARPRVTASARSPKRGDACNSLILRDLSDWLCAIRGRCVQLRAVIQHPVLNSNRGKYAIYLTAQATKKE